MERVLTRSRKNEKGFTLVELAIVMIIIGLLIVGILKGQEMIANAQVSSTITQIKAMDAATSTFKDMFNAFPGDMAGANNRLRNCDGTTLCNSGNGNGQLGNAFDAALTNATEGTFFFNQLAAADLISGVDGQNLTFGSGLPAAPVGGGFVVGHSTGVGAVYSTGNLRPGHYLAVTGANVDASDTSGVLLSSQAARIDRKLDDGLGDSGSVVTVGGCNTAGVYDESDNTLVCNVAVRIQG